MTCRTTARHVFIENRRIGVLEHGAFEQVYGCTKCNTERRYGLLG